MSALVLRQYLRPDPTPLLFTIVPLMIQTEGSLRMRYIYVIQALNTETELQM